MYSGTTPSCVGTARVATTKTSSHLLPRKRSFAKAHPASVEKRTTDAAITVELKIEFHSAGQKFTAGLLTTVMALAMKLPPGIHDMFGSLRVEAVPRADQERPVVGEDRRDGDDRESDVDPEAGADTADADRLRLRRRCLALGMLSSTMASWRGGLESHRSDSLPPAAAL